MKGVNGHSQNRGTVDYVEGQSRGSTSTGGSRGKTIKKALMLIRKANTEVHPIDIEKAKVRSAELKSTHPGSTLPYGEAEPYVMKSLKDLKASAKEHFAMELEKRHLDNTSESVGKLRRIFPELVGEVCKAEKEIENEEKKKSALAQAQARKALNALSKGDDKGGFNSPKMRPSTATPSRGKRVDGDRSSEGGDERKGVKNIGDSFMRASHDDFNLPSPMPNPRITTICSSYNNSYSNDLIRTGSPGRSGSPGTSSMRRSIIEGDDKLKKVKAMKHEIEESRRLELLDRIVERDTRAQRGMELFLLHNNQRIGLKLVAACSRFVVFYELVIELRKNKEQRRLQSLQKKAVWSIEQWWWKKRLDLQVWRHPKRNELANYTLRMICNYKIRSRRRASELIKQFIKDQSVLSDYMKKIYAFRGKALRVQRYMKSWIACRRARLQILDTALVRLQTKRMEAVRVEAIRKERAALMAAGRMGGFAETLVHINSKIDKLQGVYEIENNIMNTATKQEQQYNQTLSRIRSEADMKSKGRKAKKNKNGEFKSPGSPDSRESFESQAFKKMGVRNNSKTKRRDMSWYESMKGNPEHRDRLDMLEDVLIRLRKDHILNLKMQREKIESRKRDVMKVDIDSIMAFLSNPFSHEAIKSTSDAIETQDRAPRKYAAPFLMLTTCGGLDRLEKLAVQLLAEGKIVHSTEPL